MGEEDEVTVETEQYFRVLMQRSAATMFALQLPPRAKPLAAHVSTRGAVTGLLASYYDPEGHRWVVHHRPVHCTHAASADTVTLRVVVLMDENDYYDVHVAMATLLDATHSESARHELQVCSDMYKAANDGEAVTRPLPQSETVTLACTLPHGDGYVLCGGGFISDYPVYAARPAMPERDTHARLRRLLGDGVGTRDGGEAQDAVVVAPSDEVSYVLSTQSAGPSPCDASSPTCASPVVEEECTAWAVTAAPNAGLACFAIALRRRSPRERGGGAFIGASEKRSDGVWGGLCDLIGSKALAKTSAPGVEDVASKGVSQMARSLLLRQGVAVRHGGKGRHWCITLPAPHGSFTAPFTSRQLMAPAAVAVFYS